MNHPSRTTPEEPPAPSALGELAWLARLARALMGDVHEAEDLTQAVMVEATRRAPALEGPPLRAWLATVARRKAWRSKARRRAEQDRENAHALGTGTMAPPADQALERLDLQRALIHEIEALGKADRDLIVARYLDGQTPAAIASALGVAPPIVRVRLSRALERLRARLAADGRERWSVGLAVLAGLPRSSAASLAAPSFLAASILTMLKLTAAAAVAILTAFFLHGLRRDGAAPSAPQAEPQGIAQAPELDVDSPSGTASPAETGRRSASATLPDQGTTSIAPKVQRWLRVSLSTGAPAVDARGVSVARVGDAGEADAQVQSKAEGRATAELPFGDRGEAPIPTTFTGAAYVSHPGFRSVRIPIDKGSEDVAVTLEPQAMLTGTVTVDGAAPGTTLVVSDFLDDEAIEMSEEERPARDALEAAGIIPARLAVELPPSGTFSMPITWPTAKTDGARLEFKAPADMLVRTVNGVLQENGRREFSVSPGAQHFTVDLERLPAVRGRFIWSDTKLPVPGTLYHLRLRGKKTLDGLRWTYLAADGGFAVSAYGLKARPSEGAQSPSLPGPRADTLRLSLGSPKEASHFSRDVDLRGAELPLDLGVIEVDRLAGIPLLVQGRHRDGRLEAVDAVAATDHDVTQTGPDGRASVLCPLGGKLHVQAPGWHYRAVEIHVVPPGPHAPLKIILEPAPRLILAGLDAVRALDNGEAPIVRIDFDWTPFASASLDEQGRGVPYTHRLFTQMGRPGSFAAWSHVTPGAPGSVDFLLPEGDTLEIPGIAPQRSFRVQLIGADEKTLRSHDVRLEESVRLDLSRN